MDEPWLTALLIAIGVLTLLNGVIITVLARAAHRDRRSDNHKSVLADHVALLVQREASTQPEDDGVTVETHLWPSNRIPRHERGWLKRFKGRWLQRKHLPFRIRHYPMAAVLRRPDQTFKVQFTLVSSPSRRDAMNSLMPFLGYQYLIPPFQDQPNNYVIYKMGAFGYLLVEPALPRRRWKRKIKKTRPDDTTVRRAIAQTSPILLPCAQTGD